MTTLWLILTFLNVRHECQCQTGLVWMQPRYTYVANLVKAQPFDRELIESLQSTKRLTKQRTQVLIIDRTQCNAVQ